MQIFPPEDRIKVDESHVSMIRNTGDELEKMLSAHPPHTANTSAPKRELLKGLNFPNKIARG